MKISRPRHGRTINVPCASNVQNSEFLKVPVSAFKIWRQSRIAWLQRAPNYVEGSILTVALLFGQFFGAFCDFLEHFFHLALLLGRDILKCTFDESGVLAEDRNEYAAPFLREGNSANAAIALAFHAADQPLLVQSIDRHADRSGV